MIEVDVDAITWHARLVNGETIVKRVVEEVAVLGAPLMPVPMA